MSGTPRPAGQQAYIEQIHRAGTDAELAECARRGITLTFLRAEQRQHANRAPDRNEIEETERRESVRIYRAHGCIVYNLSQPQHAKYLTPGMPDLWIFRPASARAWFHEVKRPVGGRVSPAQQEFRDYCHATATGYVLGDHTAATDHLRALGVAVDL